MLNVWLTDSLYAGELLTGKELSRRGRWCMGAKKNDCLVKLQVPQHRYRRLLHNYRGSQGRIRGR